MTFRIAASDEILKVPDLLTSLKEKVENLVRERLTIHTSVKINFELFGLYFLEEKKIFEIKSFQTKYEIMTAGMDFTQYYDDVMGILDRKESEFQASDSGELYKISYCYH